MTARAFTHLDVSQCADIADACIAAGKPELIVPFLLDGEHPAEVRRNWKRDSGRLRPLHLARDARITPTMDFDTRRDRGGNRRALRARMIPHHVLHAGVLRAIVAMNDGPQSRHKRSLIA